MQRFSVLGNSLNFYKRRLLCTHTRSPITEEDVPSHFPKKLKGRAFE